MPPLTAADVLSVPHLSKLPENAAEALAGELLVRSYLPRESVANEGEVCRGFFQIVSGRARLLRTGPDGREQIMRILHPGETFGEVAVLDGGPFPATVDTLEESTVILIPSAVFLRVLGEYPIVATELLRYLARRLRSFTELVEQISLQTVQQRVARYLYVTAREEGQDVPEGVLIARAITLGDLASLVGSVREVVSRTLHIIESDGVVEVRRKEILIRDIEALRRML